MENLMTLYSRFANLTPNELMTVLWQMLPGALMGVGLALVALFLREMGVGFLQRKIETKRRYKGLLLWVKWFLESLKTWFVCVAGLYVAVQTMPMMGSIDGPARRLFMFAVFVQLGLMAVHALHEWNKDYTREHRTKEPARVTMMGSMVRVGYILVWLVVFILLLNTYGVDVTAMVAGLGVGGIAVAFALQNVLKDIFSSFSIVFDKPFVIGDFIIAGDYVGTVEEIGIKTTRLRALSGEQIVISNSDLLEARLRNYRTLGERRVVLTFRVDYETPADKLDKIPEVATKLLQKNDDVRVDRVHLQSLTDFGPQYEVVYYVAVPDYTRMMDINHALYIGLFKAFGKDGINFAVPVQKNVGELAEHQKVTGKATTKPSKAKVNKKK